MNKFRVANQAHNKNTKKPQFEKRSLSAFTDDEKSKNPHKIPAEYYHYIHLFGENLQNEDDDYLDRTFLSRNEILRIEEKALLGKLNHWKYQTV